MGVISIFSKLDLGYAYLGKNSMEVMFLLNSIRKCRMMAFVITVYTDFVSLFEILV
jgi:hypothetical protein